MRLCLIASICLLLGGCSTYVWYHPNKNQAQANADVARCQQQAFQQQPIRMVEREVWPASRTPDVTECTQIYSGMRCVTKPGVETPARYRTDDVNEWPRKRSYDRCMEAFGYQLKEV